MPSWAMGQLPRVLRCIRNGGDTINRDIKRERRRRRGGVVAGRREVDTPANERRCRNKRHGEEEEVTDAMAIMEEDAVGIRMMAAG